MGFSTTGSRQRLVRNGVNNLMFSDPAYFGFTGGTGSCANIQHVGNFLLVPEPATIALLALGGLAMIRRKKR